MPLRLIRVRQIAALLSEVADTKHDHLRASEQQPATVQGVFLVSSAASLGTRRWHGPGLLNLTGLYIPAERGGPRRTRRTRRELRIS